MKKKQISRFLMLAAALFLCGPVLKADWTFAMLGDTRGEKSTTTTGVSTNLNIIAQKIASLNPDLVMVAGDLCNGNDIPSSSPLNDYALQFACWKTAMQPVFNYSTGTGIPIYTVRGNHENNDGEGPTIPALKQAYYDAFNAYVPLNGPNNSSTDNQIGFSYSFTHNNVTFVVADQYFYYNQIPDQSGYHSLDQAWVSDQFQQADTPYKIFMAHVPIFMTEGQVTPEHFFGTTAAGLATRANFWNMLGTNGVQLYLTGHIHNETVAGTTNGYGDSIIQLLAGNGGAPLDPVVNDPDPGVEMLYTNGLFGFSLATVRSDAMTIQYYSLNTSDNSWTVADYTTRISANSAVTLGAVFTLNAADLGNDRKGSPFGDTSFGSKPKAFGTYYDPIKDAGKTNLKKANLKVHFDKEAPSSFDHEWAAKICLYDKRKILPGQTAAVYIPLVQVDSLPMTDFWISAKNSAGNSGPFDGGDLTLVPPKITGVFPDSTYTLGTEINTANAGAVIYVQGRHFGTKTPKVWIEYQVKGRTGTIIKTKSCKVEKSYAYPDYKGNSGKSCMDLNSTTGLSRMAVEIPERLHSDWDSVSATDHNIVMDNGIGRATFTFDVNQ